MRETGGAIMAALETNLARVGVPARVVGHPMVFDAVFTDQPVVDYRGAFSGDADSQQRFNAALRARGVLKSGNKFYIGWRMTRPISPTQKKPSRSPPITSREV